MPARKSAAQRMAARQNRSKAACSEALLVTKHICIPEKPVAESLHTVLRIATRSSSQKSISTDEGSSSSGCSSSAVCSDAPCNYSPCNAPATHQADVQERCRQPLWVSNGLAGDDSAWVLVMPRRPQPWHHVPKSPKDVVLLGPYVTTKNTFLDESKVGDSLGFPQRIRSKSVGAFTRSNV